MNPTPQTAGDGDIAVNVSLTVPAQRRKPTKAVENRDFASFCRRIIRAHARRVAAGDVEALTDLINLSSALDEAINDAVRGLRAEPYVYSWAEIARRLGISKQAAQQRWGKP
ncbi:hypothetical protein F4553_003960 [Allocatelliglobosispora scoriae]|uniref:Uncharacterized protein n=1 Tax=Allocatelliglobosispora scoriae TaxID=643052 RepID=A0A841BV06_9ACTN|nr:hypothetical protein [Allocatelliglobosispora scoriae]MBB5870581.1 hypothetical protein [Allocatelliglobosispora scoriae]